MQIKSITKTYSIDTDDVCDFLSCIDDTVDFDVNDDIFPAEVKVSSNSMDTFRKIEIAAQQRGIAYKSTLYSGGGHE